MPKYRVYGIMTACITVGEYEAANEKDALEMANNDDSANWMPSICHQCSREIDLGDIYETDVEVIED